MYLTLPNNEKKTTEKQKREMAFHVFVLQKTARKCTKIYKARAQLLFCSLNLLFGGVYVAVAVVFCVVGDGRICRFTM